MDIAACLHLYFVYIRVLLCSSGSLLTFIAHFAQVYIRLSGELTGSDTSMYALT